MVHGRRDNPDKTSFLIIVASRSWMHWVLYTILSTSDGEPLGVVWPWAAHTLSVPQGAGRYPVRLPNSLVLSLLTPTSLAPSLL